MNPYNKPMLVEFAHARDDGEKSAPCGTTEKQRKIKEKEYAHRVKRLSLVIKAQP